MWSGISAILSTAMTGTLFTHIQTPAITKWSNTFKMNTVALIRLTKLYIWRAIDNNAVPPEMTGQVTLLR